MICDRPGLRTVAVDANGIVYALGFSDGLIVIRFMQCSPEFAPDSDRGIPRLMIPDARLDAHRAQIVALAFGVRDDCAHLASAAEDGKVIIWRNKAGEWRPDCSFDNVDASSIAFSDSGNLFAMALSNEVRVYENIGAREPFIRVDAGVSGRLAVAFSRDNLLTVDDIGLLKIWEGDRPIGDLQLSNWSVRCLSACGDAIGAIVQAPTAGLSLVQTVRRQGAVLRPGMAFPMRLFAPAVKLANLDRPSIHSTEWPPCQPDIGFFWTAGGHGMVHIAYCWNTKWPAVHEIWQTNFVERMDGQWVMGAVTAPEKSPGGNGNA